MENHHFYWENSLFQWPFSIAMLNYQRVENSRRTGEVSHKDSQRAKQGKSRASLARCIVLYMPHTPCEPSFELVELYIHILYLNILESISSAQNKAFVSTGGWIHLPAESWVEVGSPLCEVRWAVTGAIRWTLTWKLQDIYSRSNYRFGWMRKWWLIRGIINIAYVWFENDCRLVT